MDIIGYFQERLIGVYGEDMADLVADIEYIGHRECFSVDGYDEDYIFITAIDDDHCEVDIRLIIKDAEVVGVIGEAVTD